MDITNSARGSVWKMSYGYYQQCKGKCVKDELWILPTVQGECVEDELWILLTVQGEVCGR